MKKYKINDIFTSIQGEGSRMGTTCVFVRFQGCNLKCDYCDTPEAISFSDYKKEYTLEQLLNEIPQDIPNVVFTGGEPLAHLDDKLLGELVKDRKHITIQTNGTLVIDEYIESTLSIGRTLVCCDIKNFKNTNNLLKTILNMGKSLIVEYKIPVSSIAEAREADRIVSYIKQLIPYFNSTVYISPIIKPTQNIQKVYAKYVNECTLQHTRLNFQLHKLIGVK